MGFSSFVVEKQRMLHFWSAWGEIQNPPNYSETGVFEESKMLSARTLERDRTALPLQEGFLLCSEANANWNVPH